MRIILPFILILISSALFAQEDDSLHTMDYTLLASPYDSLISDTIMKISMDDAYARYSVDSTFKKYGKDSPEWKAAWAYLQYIDNRNNSAIKYILAKINAFPSVDIVGEDVSHYFWLILQHQDNDTALQKRALDLMKIAVYDRKASPKDYAYLVDRVKVNTRQKQVYGTQCVFDKDKGKYVPRPIEDPDNVDERRSEMQLLPLVMFLKELNHPEKVEKIVR